MSMTYKEAVIELRIAQRLFNDAEPEYVETAIHRLNAARARLDAFIREARKGVIV